MDKNKNRRVALLIVTLIALAALIACITAPLLVTFALGLVVGAIMSILTILYYMLTNK